MNPLKLFQTSNIHCGLPRTHHMYYLIVQGVSLQPVLVVCSNDTRTLN